MFILLSCLFSDLQQILNAPSPPTPAHFKTSEVAFFWSSQRTDDKRKGTKNLQF